MKELRGIPASKGVVIGKALLYLEDALPHIPCYSIKKERITDEWLRFQNAAAAITEKIKLELNELRLNNPRLKTSKEQRGLLEARLLMFEDVDFHENVRRELENKLQNIEYVVWSVSQKIARKLSGLSSAEFRERASDVLGMAQELLNKLLAVHPVSLAGLDEEVIVAARDLLPWQALSMNKDFVKAVVTDVGSYTSHTAIIARSCEIPAVMGLSSCSAEVKTGDTLIVDGDEGLVIVDPDQKTLDFYQKMTAERGATPDTSAGNSDGGGAQTTDGRRFTLKVNAETAGELKRAAAYGAEGVGLYRSEFAFITENRLISEESQYQAYSEILKAAGKMPVTIRTFDVGADKITPGLLQTAGEKNPLLGWRAIRLSLAMPDIFKMQLRALLRASVHGNLRVMFPLVSGIEELEQALFFWEEAKAECAARNQSYSDDIPVGVMIEVPSAVLVAGRLIEKSDFFSIGSNDLMQYTLGVDRDNEKVGRLARPSHPAILQLVKMTIDAAHKQGKTAAMCGEMAGNAGFTRLLVGLGLDEFSMSAAFITGVKRIIRESSFAECQKLAEKALACAGADEVEKLLACLSPVS